MGFKPITFFLFFFMLKLDSNYIKYFFLGTAKWVNNLQWKNSSECRTKTQKRYLVNDIIEGFVRNCGNLEYYEVERAGHMVSHTMVFAQKFGIMMGMLF